MGVVDAGARLSGRYLLRQRIGGGGTAEVWRAWDELLDRQVAVKLAHTNPSSGPEVLRRFLDEARAASALSHPHAAIIYDCDEVVGADGALIPYIVTELLEGETLADRIRRGALPVGEAVRVCADLADGLAAAHRAGIVHRDVRPAKVFLTPDGVKVRDFGTGRALEVPAPGPWPEPEALPASLAYRPPEERSGPAADVYALGVVLTEALTGRRALDAALPDGIPVEVAVLCSRCRAHDPAARPSAAEVAEILNGPGLPGRRLPPGETPIERPGAELPAGRFPLAETPIVRPGDEVSPPDPAWVPAADDPPAREAEDAVGPSPSRRRIVVEGALSVVACGVAVLLLSAISAPRAGPDSGGQAGSPMAAGPLASSPARTPGLAQQIAALNRLRPIISQGLAAGEIRSDVALDLDHVVTELRNALLGGQRIDREQRLTELATTIAVRLREGGLTRGRADELNAALSAARPKQPVALRARVLWVPLPARGRDVR